MTFINSSIALRKLELGVHLGWPLAERLAKQNVYIDIHVQFSAPPQACTTDQLEDTYCYETLNNLLKESIVQRQFRLIEHLGHEIYHLVKKFFPQDALVTVGITKNPPILNLNEASFWYGDEKK